MLPHINIPPHRLDMGSAACSFIGIERYKLPVNLGKNSIFVYFHGHDFIIAPSALSGIW